ncbi:hypothetical protein [Mesorhizobium sophorae]|uniref:hypothetical protein n=1 Tax=Mesorhizobium sophorae TaxID=1300294 RepID=UPI000BA2D9BB|nr:hypothetical protein [Mesorhizobium sophorae]
MRDNPASATFAAHGKLKRLHCRTTMALASHDFCVIRTIADRVMPAQGLVVEQGPTRSSRTRTTPVPSNAPTWSLIPQSESVSGKIMLKPRDRAKERRDVAE